MLFVEPFGRIPWSLTVDLDPAFFQIRLQQINDFNVQQWMRVHGPHHPLLCRGNHPI
ncbi:hypothetical protein GT204_21600 [Streptomyces sp. SID4919]|uniref:hypothetical protein n=1 Tax=unclassified Streptomyces TaxID=2593676 RepID=UPI00082387D0|nr:MULTISPECIES: hypothetical protein [unclassified Streptomyces]MYY11429.1 hypothetical protein [Streptomyces sp. SID4919]SCK57805.1 hypothetical protein YW7DRAFT_05467 [Streptomyces sp. AmelKG-E11A]